MLEMFQDILPEISQLALLPIFTKIFPSLIKQNFPLFKSDAPIRVEADKNIPVTCEIINPDKSRIIIEQILIKVFKQGKIIHTHKTLKRPLIFEDDYKLILEEIELVNEISGNLSIDVEYQVKIAGSDRRFTNDNFRFTKQNSLAVNKSRHNFPKLNGYCFGDFFNILNFIKNDGTPSISPSALAQFENSKGNNFAAASVISTNGLSNHDNINLWKNFKQEIAASNSNSNTIIMPAEYVTCKNSKGRKIKLIVINHSEKLVRSKATPSKGMEPEHANSKLESVFSKLNNEQELISIAYNPAVSHSLFEKMIKKQGEWIEKDLVKKELSSVNIDLSKDYTTASEDIKKWTLQLLKGQKKSLSSGSNYVDQEIHSLRYGSFNSSKTENKELRIGRIGIHSGSTVNTDTIMRGIKEGRIIITNGPVMKFGIKDEEGNWVGIGRDSKSTNFTLGYKLNSTPEMGHLRKLSIFIGNIDKHDEELIFTLNFTNDNYEIDGSIELEAPIHKSYIRCELFSGEEENERFCFTNPIWIEA